VTAYAESDRPGHVVFFSTMMVLRDAEADAPRTACQVS
jgi:hypothetical protein